MSFTGGASLGTASYTITGNAQGAVNASRQAQNALDQLSNTVATNWWGLRNLAMGFAALPAAIAGGVGYAIKAAKDWQDSMFQVGRTTGLTGDELEKIEKQLRAVAARTPIAAKEIAELASQGAALGVPEEFLGEFARIMGGLISTTDLTTASVDEFARVVNVMQVPVSEWESFANVLLEVGRNTAATETEILNMAKRIAPAAQAAGVAAHEVLGLSAAVLSLGPRAEAGGTAVNKTFGDMARAVSGGVSASNKELNLFADVSGKTAEQFVNDFRNAPGAAFAAVMTGLGHLKGGYEEQIRVLDALGIKEVRQAQALIALAGGTRSLNDEQRNLNTIFGATGKWLTESNALQDLSAQKAKTLSGQLILLQNILDQHAATFGSVLLPAIGAFLNFLANMITGFSALPGPLKAAILIIGGLVGVLTALAAGFLLLGPRILIARDAFNQVMASIHNFRNASNGLQPIMARTGLEALAMGAQFTRASQLVQIAGYRAQSGLQALGIAAAAAQAQANGVGVVAGKGLSKGAKGGLIGMAVMTAATIGLGVVTNKLGSTQRETASETADLSDATLDLSEATEGVNDDLLRTEENAKKAAKAARELRERLEGIASATLGVVEAQRGQEDALRAVEEAERNYEKVLQQNYDTTREITRAELELAQARAAAEEAANNLEDAEYNLLHAREIAEEQIADAEDKLADARDKQIDISERIIDLEQQLVDLRGADYLEKIADAEEDLANARLKLRRASQYAQDAEWQLQYLREEGASARDIADAELTLAEARQEVVDAQDDVSDGEKELSDLRDETARNREIARIEREIAGAHRDAAGAARDITQMERDLLDLRQEFAEGKYLIDAQNEYRDALLGVEQAALAVREAELKLEDARTGRAAREINDAFDQYEEALYNVAKANVEMRKQQALARGEIFDSGDEAHALAEELRKLANALPEGELKNKFLGMADTLSTAPNVPDPIKEDDSGGAGVNPGNFGLPTNAELDKYLKGLLKTVEANTPGAQKKGFDWGATLGGAMTGGLLGATIGSAVAPGVGTVIGAIIGAIIGALISNYGQISEWLHDIAGPAIYDGFLAGWEKLKEWGRGIQKWINDYFLNPLRMAFRIHSPSQVMADIGRDVVQGFVNGILSMGDSIRGIAWTIGATLSSGFSTAKDWLINAGAAAIEGFKSGAMWVAGTVGSIASSIASTIGSSFTGVGGWLFSTGRALIDGLRDGIKWAFDNTLKPIWNWIVSKLPGDMADKWMIRSPSRVFADIGSQLMKGLAVGIDGTVPAVDKALQNMNDIIGASMDTVVPSAMLDSLMRQPNLLNPTDYTPSGGGSGDGGTTNNYYNDTFNLEAHTDADSQEIVEDFMWTKMVRPRGR